MIRSLYCSRICTLLVLILVLHTQRWNIHARHTPLRSTAAVPTPTSLPSFSSRYLLFSFFRLLNRRRLPRWSLAGLHTHALVPALRFSMSPRLQCFQANPRSRFALEAMTFLSWIEVRRESFFYSTYLLLCGSLIFVTNKPEFRPAQSQKSAQLAELNGFMTTHGDEGMIVRYSESLGSL